MFGSIVLTLSDIEEKSMDTSEIERRRWKYLFFSCFGLLFSGVIYAWSILKTPLASALSVSATTLSLAYTVSICSYCIGSLICGNLVKKLSPRVLLITSSVLVFTGFLLTSHLEEENGHLLLASYGAIVGLGVGFSYNILVSVGNSWFPDRKGVSSGLLMMSFGLSTMLLGSSISSLFEIEGIGWRRTYIILGAVMATVILLCSFFLHFPSREERSNLPGPVPKKGRSNFSVEYTAGEMLRRSSFWVYYFFGILNAAVGSAVISFARDLSVSVGATVATATLLVGVLSLSNGLGRILCGMIFDRFGFRVALTWSASLTVTASSGLLLAVLFGSSPLLVISFCLTGLSFGSNPTVGAALIGTFYGSKDYPLNQSISNTKLMFSSFAATAAGSLYASSGSYVLPFVMLTVLALLSFCMSFMIRRP